MTDKHEWTTCCVCGIEFGVPRRFIESRRETGGDFCCPNGHTLFFKETEFDRLKRERDRLKQDQAYFEDRLREDRERIEAAERRVSAYKGQVTKLRNRAKAGLCPCCNRHFDNLQRHIASKHPDLSLEPDLTVIEGGRASA